MVKLTTHGELDAGKVINHIWTPYQKVKLFLLGHSTMMVNASLILFKNVIKTCLLPLNKREKKEKTLYNRHTRKKGQTTCLKILESHCMLQITRSLHFVVN